MLEISGLGAGYGRVQVLHDVDLTVGDGEIVALVGSNGAGKSTLLRTISGLLAPMSGSITWNGTEIAGRNPEHIVGLGLAHVPEGRRLFPGLTVQENLRIGAYRRGNRDLGRVLEVFPHLKGRLGQVAGSLSGGEQQMCAIGRGLMSDPDLLMVDELSLGLAPKLVEQILDRLTAVTETGTSLLLVEQDVEAAMDVAARSYVLEIGEIVVSGLSEELRSDDRVREAYLGL